MGPQSGAPRMADGLDGRRIDIDRSEPAIWLDESGLLHRGTAWIALSDTEWMLMRPLAENFAETVTRTTLVEAAWTSAEVGERCLSQRMGQLRRRIETMGLTVFTIRGRGYLLDFAGHAPVKSPRPLR